MYKSEILIVMSSKKSSAIFSKLVFLKTLFRFLICSSLLEKSGISRKWLDIKRHVFYQMYQRIWYSEKRSTKSTNLYTLGERKAHKKRKIQSNNFEQSFLAG